MGGDRSPWYDFTVVSFEPLYIRSAVVSTTLLDLLLSTINLRVAVTKKVEDDMERRASNEPYLAA